MLRKIMEELNKLYFERSKEIALIARALIAGLHVLFLGRPGIGKSDLVNAFTDRLQGCNTFRRLVRRDSTVDEFFGPVSIKSLQADEWKRQVNTKKLPHAHVAFIDEVFKSNSTLLNGFLTIMNERFFENGDTIIDSPLITMVGASNEKPQSKDLEAFWDRFHIRHIVQDISADDSFLAYLESKVKKPSRKPQYTMTLKELEAERAAAEAVDVPKDILEALVDLRRKLSADGISPTCRRWGQVIQYLKAIAYLDDRKTVENDDLAELCEFLWETEEQIGKINSILAQVASPEMGQILELLDAGREAFNAAEKAGKDPKAFFTYNDVFKKTIKSMENLARTASGKGKAKAIEGVRTLEGWQKTILNKYGVRG